MKKIFSLSILFISILFMSMSCEPDPIEPVFPSEVRTAADLEGTWEFVSFYYHLNYQTCDLIPEYENWLISFEFDGVDKVTMTDECNGTFAVNWLYEVVAPSDPEAPVAIYVKEDQYGTPIIFHGLLYNGDGEITMKRTLGNLNSDIGVLIVQKQ